MELFAGPIFDDWYWEPIGRAVVWVPVLTVVACLVDLVVRRGLRPPRWPRFGVIELGAWAAGTVLILGGGLLIESGRFARESRAVARTIDFTAYEPRPLPPPFVLESAEAGASAGTPVIVTRYDAGTGYASVTQARPPGGARTPFNGRCVVAGSSVACREVRTPKGIPVVMAEPYGPSFLDASAVLDGTLVNVRGSSLAEPSVLAYFDSLEPVDAGELEFKRAD